MIPAALALALLASNPQPAPAAKPAAAEAAKPAAAPEVSDSAECHHPPTDATAKAAPEVILRGEKVPTTDTVNVTKVLADASKLDGKTLVIEGTVRKACERKGCWMELASATDDKNPGIRVTFKDYGFFVPLDSAGSKARVSGVLKLAQLSEERAKHYESEGALVPRDAKGTPREVQLLATGVELRR